MPGTPETGGLMQTFNPESIPVALAWLLGAFLLVYLTKRILRSMSEIWPNTG